MLEKDFNADGSSIIKCIGIRALKIKFRSGTEFGVVFLQGRVVISATSNLIEVVMQEVLVQF
ncbi:hypothetical protein D3C81_2124960 [compost metagenome]